MLSQTNKQTWFIEDGQFGVATAYQLKHPEPLHSEKTPFQQIDIYETEHFGRLLVFDGLIMLTSRDNFFYHEMMTHTALFTHPDPKDVVIIGGGDCGTLREVLKHPKIRKATQVEIDERVTRLCEEFFPELCLSNHDPRAELLFEDGIAWMQQAPTGSLDVVIVDSTDPVGMAEGLFNESFYKECFRVLRPQGVIIQQGESPLLHADWIKGLYSIIPKAGFELPKMVNFPQPSYPSGWWSAMLTTKGLDPLKFREQDAQHKTFATHYYNAEIHMSSLAIPEIFKRRGDEQNAFR